MASAMSPPKPIIELGYRRKKIGHNKLETKRVKFRSYTADVKGCDYENRSPCFPRSYLFSVPLVPRIDCLD